MAMPALLKTSLQVFTDGPPAAKVATSGFAVLFAAFTDVAAGVMFAALVSLWGIDMLLGMAVAISKRDFRFGRFAEGFGKGFAAVCGIALGIVLDTVGADMVESYDGTMAVTVAMTGIAFAFAWSALENFGHWFPSVADKLRSMLKGQSEPERVDLSGLSEETRVNIRALRESDLQAKRSP